jgi:hypothetical protein
VFVVDELLASVEASYLDPLAALEEMDNPMTLSCLLACYVDGCMDGETGEVVMSGEKCK